MGLNDSMEYKVSCICDPTLSQLPFRKAIRFLRQPKDHVMALVIGLRLKIDWCESLRSDMPGGVLRDHTIPYI